MQNVIIAYLLSHPLILIALLGFIYNIFFRSRTPKANPGQRNVMQEMELQRKRLLEEQARQQAALDDTETFRQNKPKSLGMNDQDADPDGLFTTGKSVVVSQTSSSSSSSDQQMKDFQADILAALGMKPDSSSSSNSPQEVLRRQLAQKMGRAATTQQPSKAAQLTAQQQEIVAREAKNPTSRDASGGITSSLRSEMTSNSTNNIVDSNAQVVNSSMEVKLERNRSLDSRSTRFGSGNDVVRGVIWSEILNKPKSARR